MNTSLSFLGAAILSLLCLPASADERPVRAEYLVTVADDFVVDVYHNGNLVEDSKRHLLADRFGATVEGVSVQVHAGDWLVFNVVNNRLRWKGASYFAVAGCLAKDQITFVTCQDSHWFVCDTPGDVAKFIAEKDYFRHLAQPIQEPWKEGDKLMKKFAGDSWSGSPLWGASRNTWIKVVVK